jgi:hypothetical protein
MVFTSKWTKIKAFSPNTLDVFTPTIQVQTFMWLLLQLLLILSGKMLIRVPNDHPTTLLSGMECLKRFQIMEHYDHRFDSGTFNAVEIRIHLL